MKRILGISLALAIAQASGASAGERRYSADGQGDYVVTQSRYGGRTISGPVRMTSVGREVRLPGGNWEPCKRSCAETLRASTVDYWDSRGPNPVATECGIFGCLEVGYPR